MRNFKRINRCFYLPRGASEYDEGSIGSKPSSSSSSFLRLLSLDEPPLEEFPLYVESRDELVVSL